MNRAAQWGQTLGSTGRAHTEDRDKAARDDAAEVFEPTTSTFPLRCLYSLVKQVKSRDGPSKPPDAREVPGTYLGPASPCMFALLVLGRRRQLVLVLRGLPATPRAQL